MSLLPPSPAEEARLLTALVDALVPGDGRFPAASAVGVQAVLAGRLRDSLGPKAPSHLATLLQAAAGAGRDFEAAARAVEQREPALFAAVLAATYLAYYESPAVVRLLRELGHDYNDAPQPMGYAMEPFDPQRDAPRHRRGRFVATDEVRPVDPVALDFLER